MTKQSKLEKISLRLFLICMVMCAGFFLFLLWTGGPDQPDNQTLFSIVATFFVVGLASFLIWLPIVIYKLIDALKNNKQ